MATPWSSPSHWSHWGNGRPMVAARDTGCCSLPEAMWRKEHVAKKTKKSKEHISSLIWQDLHISPISWYILYISCMMRPFHFAKHGTRMYQARLRTNHPIITDRISVQNTMGKRVSNDMAATGSYLADLVKHRDITHGWWCSNMFQWNAHETTIHQSKRGSSFSSFWMIYDPCAWRWWPLGALTTKYGILLHMIYIYTYTYVTSYVYVFSPPKMVVNPAFWWDIVGYSL